jgi:hypothetical protein
MNMAIEYRSIIDVELIGLYFYAILPVKLKKNKHDKRNIQVIENYLILLLNSI